MSAEMSGPSDILTDQRVVLVTGPSGAGRSTAIKVLEDLGFETIDNLPLSLIPRLLEGPPLQQPLALGLDARNRDFSSAAVVEMIQTLAAKDHIQAEVLYLDCSEDVLLRRYSETRRRHPLAPAEAPGIGILRENDLLKAIRNMADFLIDTSDLTPHDLRDEITSWFGQKSHQRLAVSVQSFSYKRGIPRGVDMVFDCRFLRNPYWQENLRALTGRSELVVAHIREDLRFGDFFDRVHDLTSFLLPAYTDEGKAHLSVGFGCTGGQHRSVAVAELLASSLAKAGWQVSIRHRELDRAPKTVGQSGSKTGDMIGVGNT